MNQLQFALSVLIFFVASQAFAERILSRNNARVYIEAEDHLAMNRSVDVYYRGKRLGRFKVIKYLEKREVLVVKDRRRKLRPDMNVSVRSPRSMKRRPAAERKYHVFKRHRSRRGTQIDYGVYAGTGAVGPLGGGGYIDEVDPGYSFGAFALYKLNRKWDVKVAVQMSETTGRGKNASAMGVDSVAGLSIGVDANFDYEVEGTIQTIKIPITANYNYSKNWVFRIGGYVDFITGATYDAKVKVTSIEADGFGTIDAFNFNEISIQQDITEYMNTTSVGITSGASYVLGSWRFNFDAGYSFNQAFKSGVVIDEVDIGELDVFGFASVPISQKNIQLEKPENHSGFGQITISYMF